LKFHPLDDRAVLEHIDADGKIAGGHGRPKEKAAACGSIPVGSRSFLNDLGTFSNGVSFMKLRRRRPVMRHPAYRVNI
jgi:hypothetical protein